MGFLIGEKIPDFSKGIFKPENNSPARRAVFSVIDTLSYSLRAAEQVSDRAAILQIQPTHGTILTDFVFRSNTGFGGFLYNDRSCVVGSFQFSDEGRNG